METGNAKCPECIQPSHSAAPCRTEHAGTVSQSLRPDEREGRLKAAAYLRELALRRWERYGREEDRAQADAYQLEMDAMGAKA